MTRLPSGSSLLQLFHRMLLCYSVCLCLTLREVSSIIIWESSERNNVEKALLFLMPCSAFHLTEHKIHEVFSPYLEHNHQYQFLWSHSTLVDTFADCPHIFFPFPYPMLYMLCIVSRCRWLAQLWHSSWVCEGGRDCLHITPTLYIIVGNGCPSDVVL